jgi:hypothetical protein
MSKKETPGAFGKDKSVSALQYSVALDFDKKGAAVENKAGVKLEKGNVTPIWLLGIRVLWFVLSHVLHLVALIPLGCYNAFAWTASNIDKTVNRRL